MSDNEEANIKRNWPPIVAALAAQAAAFALCFGLATVAQRSAIKIDLPLILAAQGLAAAVLGHHWGLARWWLPLQMVMPIAAGAALMLALPSWIYLAVFIAMVAVFWNASGDRVPLYLTNRTTWRAITDLTSETGNTRILDIGSGLGGLLVFVGRERPNMTVEGIESAPLPYAIAWLRLKLAARPNVRPLYGDFWGHDLSDYDVVYAFLSPAPMAALFEKVKKEMKPGSVFISNSFAVPGEQPDEIVQVADRRQTQLLIWRR